MSKARRRKRTSRSRYELARQYRFDYALAKPNRFAGSFTEDTIAVVLDPDVARVFRDSETVNAFLRAAIAAVRGSRSRRTR